MRTKNASRRRGFQPFFARRSSDHIVGAPWRLTRLLGAFAPLVMQKQIVVGGPCFPPMAILPERREEVNKVHWSLGVSGARSNTVQSKGGDRLLRASRQPKPPAGRRPRSFAGAVN